MAQGQSGSRVRKYIGIDPDDEAILAWWDAQKKPSASIRDLIVEAIEKRGVSDYHFRNVKQLPRRGRPPQLEAEETQSVVPEAVQAEPVVEPVVQPVSAPVTPVPAPVFSPNDLIGGTGVEAAKKEDKLVAAFDVAASFMDSIS